MDKLIAEWTTNTFCNRKPRDLSNALESTLTQSINFNLEKITYFEPNIKITKCRFPHKNKDAYSRTVPMLRPL